MIYDKTSDSYGQSKVDELFFDSPEKLVQFLC